MGNSAAGLRSPWTGRQIHFLNRTIICLVVAVAEGTYFLTPSNPLWFIIDVFSRTYLIFVGTVMAHEGVHGHLGRTKKANVWWGRLALLPSMVPYTNFHKTHHLHHAHTNVPEKDPDHFMKSRSIIEIPLRAIAMPHHWFFWLMKRNRIRKKDLIELVGKLSGNRSGTWCYCHACRTRQGIKRLTSTTGSRFDSALVSVRCPDA